MLRASIIQLSFVILAFLGGTDAMAQRSNEVQILTRKDSVLVHKRTEIGFHLSRKIQYKINDFLNGKEGLSPFNPNHINAQAEFISPSGDTLVRNAFYMLSYKPTTDQKDWVQIPQVYNWRIRIAPHESGNWKFRIGATMKGEKPNKTIWYHFEVLPSSHKGPLHISPPTNHLSYASDQTPFFAVGCNLSNSDLTALTPASNERHLDWIRRLKNNGGNFFRLEIGAQNWLPDWNDPKNYTSKFEELWELDRLFDLSEELDMYMILFRHHVELMDGPVWSDVKWQKNGYHLTGINKKKDYFLDENAIQLQKYALRYMEARYGYSPAWTFYGYSEIDHLVKEIVAEENSTLKAEVNVFGNWFKNQISYLRDSLHNNHILTLNTYAVYPNFELHREGIFHEQDAVGYHKYANDIDMNSDKGLVGRLKLSNNLRKSYPNVPIFAEEVGLTGAGKKNFLLLYCCTDEPFHETIWATSFADLAGTGMHWWWDRGLFDNGYETNYLALSKFFKQYNRYDYSISGYAKSGLAEYFYTRAKNGKQLIGWFNNRGEHWSQRYYHDPCIKELVNIGYFENPCRLENGDPIGEKRDDLPNYIHLQKASNPKGSPDVHPTIPIGKNLIVRGLSRSTRRGKKIHYTIKWYSSTTGELMLTQKSKVDLLGRMKLPLTEKIIQAGDAAFAIEAD